MAEEVAPEGDAASGVQRGVRRPAARFTGWPLLVRVLWLPFFFRARAVATCSCACERTGGWLVTAIA